MARKQTEIERKWLVEDIPDLSKHEGAKIIQGYVVVSPEGNEVRVRRKDDRFFNAASFARASRQPTSLSAGDTPGGNPSSPQ